MNKELVTVVIPIHLEEPPELEKVSLAQTLKLLHKYPITFMTKGNLKTTWYEEFCRGKATIHFERWIWDGFDGFGELMTSHKFYGRFRAAYKFILICHTDAFVFRDELDKWCALDYDYIGSVIYNTHWDGANTVPLRILGFTRPEYYANGGFTLKKIETFYRISYTFRLYLFLLHWVRKVRKRGFLDDIFIAQLFPNLSKSFTQPPLKIAQQFGAAYENFDEKALPFTNDDIKSLPFGTHGWTKYHPDFWKKSIRECGYDV
ncbi:MAG: DUF5672 family protein [Chryseolinea sp.]